MKRRAFLGTVAAFAASSLAPLPRSLAMVPTDDPHRWWAAGTDEMHYPFWAVSYEDAARQYAVEHGATVGDDCPECGLPDCYEHNPDLDAPAPWVEAVTYKRWESIGPETPPTTIEWLRVGYNVPCQDCADWEPTECYAFEDRALCCECLELARARHLDAIVGNTQVESCQRAAQ